MVRQGEAGLKPRLADQQGTGPNTTLMPFQGKTLAHSPKEKDKATTYAPGTSSSTKRQAGSPLEKTTSKKMVTPVQDTISVHSGFKDGQGIDEDQDN